MEVLREEEAKSKNRVPGIVEVGALAAATTVRAHNPTSDLRPSYNDEYIDKNLIEQKSQTPLVIPVESPIKRKMNTNTRLIWIVSLLPIILFATTTVFKMWKSEVKENNEESPEVGAEESAEVGAEGSAEVGAEGSSVVGAEESAVVGAEGSAEVGAEGSAEVGAEESAKVRIVESLKQEILDYEDKIKSKIREILELQRCIAVDVENDELSVVKELSSVRTLERHMKELMSGTTYRLLELCKNNEGRDAAFEYTLEMIIRIWKFMDESNIKSGYYSFFVQTQKYYYHYLSGNEKKMVVDRFEREFPNSNRNGQLFYGNLW